MGRYIIVIQRSSSILGAIGSKSRSKEVKRSREVKNPLRKNYWTKLGGKIHNCDKKNEFDFGGDRVERSKGQEMLKNH